ncbi:hypothetical protein ACNQFN_22340 [Thauera butanivorans]|uniref:hypothetical protein n=1 Tax=Thauera butanivorans TaxID=86174 RepID=UPI003AB5AC5C
MHSLVGQNPAALALLAGTDSPEGIATRYALKELIPFAIVGVDYGNLHNQDGALDLYDPETGEGELSEQWIRDRAAMLAGVLAAQTADSGEGKTLEGSTTVFPAPYFEDKASGLILRHYNAAGGSYDGSPRYLFGGDGADILEGTDHNGGTLTIDGLLARDLDNDGRIGSGQELLQTLAAAGITSIATAYDTRTDLNRAWRLSA